MDVAITLIAPPAGLNAAQLETARRAVIGLGGVPRAPWDWLAPGEAADLVVAEIDADQADAAVRAALGGEPVDIVAQPVEGRVKRLLLADMESTIIAQEMLDELADTLGRRAEIAAITARAMNGEIDFKAALAERVALLKAMPETVLDEVAARITLTPGAETLVATMRAKGGAAVLVSGGFTVFADRVRDRLGFDEAVANRLEVKKGKLTGRLLLPLRDGADKLKTLTEAAAARALPLACTLAVGDGANDLPMLGAAGLGVAYRAKPTVRAAARARIDHADLTALLYAQGYRAAELVRG